MTDDFFITHSIPRRPENGWQAWLATVGYLSAEHSPDAMLTVRVNPVENRLLWSASVSWGAHREEARAHASFPGALKALWALVDEHHRIFRTPEAASRQPTHYPANRWLDGDSATILERTFAVLRATLKTEWALVIIYQPLAHAHLRVQMRLITRGDSAPVSGRGPSLREACGHLYRNTAPRYFSR